MAPVPSPGSELKRKSAEVLGQLSQANREWSGAYYALKDEAKQTERQLRNELEKKDVLLESLQSDLASTLSLLGVPSVPALRAQLAAAPLPAGGLPVLQQALDRTRLVANAMCVLNTDAQGWWEERDAVDHALEDERQRRALVESELEALKKRSYCSDRSARSTPARSPTRQRPLTPSRASNLPPVSTAAGPPTSPSVLSAQNRALQDQLRRQKEKHRAEKRHWRLFSDKVSKWYHQGKLDPSARSSTAGDTSTSGRVTLSGLVRDSERAFASSNSPAPTHPSMATAAVGARAADSRPTLPVSSARLAADQQGTTAPSSTFRLASSNTMAGTGGTTPAQASTPPAGAVAIKSPRPPSVSKSPFKPTAQLPPALQPPAVELSQSQTQTQSPPPHNIAYALGSGGAPLPALVLPQGDEEAPAHPRILAPASDASSSSLTPLTTAPLSPVASAPGISDQNDDDFVETSIPQERPSSKLLPRNNGSFDGTMPGAAGPGCEAAAEDQQEARVQLSDREEQPPVKPSARPAESSPARLGSPTTLAVTCRSPSAVLIKSPMARTSVRPASSRAAEEDVFSAHLTRERGRLPAAPEPKRRRVSENLERFDGIALGSTRPVFPAAARTSVFHQTPIQANLPAARPKVAAYLPTPDTGTRPAAAAGKSRAPANAVASSSKAPMKSHAASTPAAPDPPPQRWLGKHIFSERIRDGPETPITAGDGSSTLKKRKPGPIDDVDIDTPVRDGGVRPLQLGLPARSNKGKRRALEDSTSRSPAGPSTPPPPPAEIKAEPTSEDRRLFARVNVANADLPMLVPDSPDPARPPLPWERTASQEAAEEAHYRALDHPTKGMDADERRRFNRSLRGKTGPELREIFAKFKGRGRYAAELAADRTINQDFEIVPEHNQGRDFAFGDVVRNRDDRQRMHGADCPCCRSYYEAVGVLQPLPAGPVWRNPPPSPERPGETDQQRAKRKRDGEIQEHRQAVSRHREDFPLPATPPEYWETGMYDDDQIEHINREARKIQLEKRRRVEAEAAPMASIAAGPDQAWPDGNHAAIDQAAGHEVIPWRCVDYATGLDLLDQIFHADGGDDLVAITAKTKEPLLPQVVVGNRTGLSVYELHQVNRLKTAFRERFQKQWMESAALTITGRPIDGIVCPVAPYPPQRHAQTCTYDYTGIYNLLDVPALAFPVTAVDPVLDAFDEAAAGPPPTELDGRIRAQYDAEVMSGAPIGLQLVGRRFQEEELLGMTEVVWAALQEKK